jgi:hypothetical protein
LLGAPFFTDPEIVFDVRKEVERAIVRHLGSATTNVSVLTSSQTWTYSEWGAECPHLDLSCDENAYLTCRDESGGQSMDAPELTQFCLKELDAVAADDACRSDSECSGDNVCSDDSVCSAPWREPEPEPVVEPEHWTATFGTDLPIENGTYTARQAATGRHLNGSGDLATGKIPQGAAPGWDFQVNGLLVYLKHEDTGRFLDAYVDDEYGAVTREWQDNPTQTWLLEPSGDGYTVRQAEKGRYLDAFESDNDDYAVVTRNKQDNNTQVWTFSSGSSRSGSFTIKQLSSSRSLATDDTSNHSALTKTKGPMWEVIVVGVTYSIGHANGQVLDAHQSLAKNYQATVSSADSSPSQYWAIVPVPNMDDFTIREVSNGQFLDAYVDDTYAVVTRTEQGDSSQRWALDPG